MQTHARKAGRWILRGALGLVGLVAAAVIAAVIVIHTDWGREQIRERLEAKLADTFVGGATVGRLEGSPFGELVARDLVINGPGGEPAISAKTVRLRLALVPLISKQARLLGVTVNDADVILDRDERGELEIAHLTKPGPKSGWSVDLPDVRLHRAHVSYDTGRGDTGRGGERMNLDGLELKGELHAPADGPLDAAIKVGATWRERAALPLEIDAALRSDDAGLAIARAYARAGDLVVTGQDVKIGRSQRGAPAILGEVTVEASRDAVARLGLGFETPADLSVRVAATRDAGSPFTRVELAGRVDGQPVTGQVRADLDAKHFAGFVATGVLDATKLSRGQVEGSGSAFVTFDMALPSDRELPVGNAIVHAWGTIEGVPDADARIAVASTGQRASALVEVAGRELRAHAAADVSKRGAAVTLHRAVLTASTGDPQRASGGAAPVHGAFHADLRASGALAPNPSLAVAGTVDGRRLRFRDLSVDSMKLAIDASQLPARPRGRAELKARGVERGTMYLAELAVNAGSRDDGKLAVSVRTRPRQNPWLVEADALVTTGDVVTIDLVRHHVRAGNNADWRGTTGRVAIAPERISVRDFATRSQVGALALDAAYHRAGRRTGDLEARLEATSLSLDTFDVRYRGVTSAKVDVQRRAGRLTAHADVSGQGIVFRPPAGPFDAQAKIDLREGRLAVDLRGGAAQLGRAALVADIATPRDATDARAWQALGRGAIRDARLTVERLDLARLASLAGAYGEHRGLIDGDVQLTRGAVNGAITARGVVTPQTQAMGKLDADLRLAETPRGELAPALAVRVDGVGSAEARATIAVPARPLDPLAWRRLGRGALVGAEVRTSEIAFDPGLLDRFGVVSNMRGRASVAIDLGAAARTARVTGRVRQLRGSPLSEPVNVELAADSGEQTTTFRLAAATRTARLVEASGRIPRSFTQLQAGGEVVRRAPLSATAKLPDVPARQLLAAFGRTDVIAGTLSGTIDVAGTVAAPTARARLTAANVSLPRQSVIPPGKPLDRLTLDARWNGRDAVVEVVGTEPGGDLRILAKVSPSALARGTVSLRATKFDLRPVLAFVPGAVGAAGGILDANLTVTGLDPQTARLAGELHLQRGRLPLAPTIGTLYRAKVDLVAGARDLRIAVDGRLGAGTVKAAGTLALVGASPTGGDFTLTLRKVSPIGAVEPQIDADVTAKLRKAEARWIADVVVRNGAVVVPKGHGEKLKPVGPPEDMVFLTGDPGGKRGRKDEPPARPVIELRVTLKPTYLQSEELRGLIRGQVTITADAEAVGLVGRIEAYRGDLDLFGHRYLVERAAARFDGSTDPLLDIVITHDFPEVTTLTTVRGRLSKPELIMSSDPGLYTQGQLLGFLLGGEPNGEPATGSARDKVTSAGTSIIANQVGGYVKEALPFDLDVLRYEAATASSSAAFTVGTWLTRSLFVSYRRRFEARSDENTGEAQAEYWLGRRVMVEGTLGDRGYSGLDLLWRKRY